MSHRAFSCALVGVFLCVGCGGDGERSGDAALSASSSPARPPARTGRFEKGKIVTDTFDLRYHLDDETLTLVLDTDLPDNTDLMVGVHRLYRHRGSSKDYVIDYYSHKSTVGAWRHAHEVSLNAERWRSDLERVRKILANAGEPFEVGEISDEVVASFVVPVNQDDSRFGAWNKNLVGRVVESDGDFRLVRAEESIPYPLGGTPSETRWADPRALQVNRTYVVESTTPLVPEFASPDPMSAIARIVQMPPKSLISIREMRSRGAEPWYRVEAASGSGEFIGSGWVNSTALIGQNVQQAP